MKEAQRLNSLLTAIDAATSPLLMEHHDFIYRKYLELPPILERA